MTEDREDPVVRLLQLLGDHLESFLDGDETALETLGESIEERGFSADELSAAVMVLRSFGAIRSAAERATWDDAPGKRALRVPSAQERDFMSPEAWGYLLDLKARGSLDPDQFERVLDRLGGSGVRPVGVDLAREVAIRVALDCDQANGLGERRHGDFDLAH